MIIRRRFKGYKKREIMNFFGPRSKNSMQSQNIGRNLASASSIHRKELIFWQIISKILDADLKITERLIICSKTFDSIGLLQESFSGFRVTVDEIPKERVKRGTSSCNYIVLVRKEGLKSQRNLNLKLSITASIILTGRLRRKDQSP